LSVAAGTYASAQSVTISDASPGAAIYYTTDGSTPTAASTVYSSPITVSVTETIKAIAIAKGLSASAVTSATYTINVPDFSLAASPASLTVTAGQSGTSSVSVTPANGFHTGVSFSCSGLPSGVTCSFSPATVTPSEAPVSTALTITTSASAAALQRDALPFSSGAVLATVLCCIGWRKRRQWPILVAIAAAAIGLGALSGCGGGSSANSTTTAHQTTTSTITVMATSGSLQHSTTISLTVN
jgi:hypothetical protein